MSVEKSRQETEAPEQAASAPEAAPGLAPLTAPGIPGILSPGHVISLQRTAGNQSVARYLAGSREPAPHIGSALTILDRVRIARVPTWGGEWTTTRYSDTPAPPATARGVDIEIEFAPNDKVNATKIGIVQTAMSQSNGTAPFADPTNFPDFNSRAQQTGPEKGLGIDQLEGYKNPLYPTNPGTSADTLGSTTLTPRGSGGGQHGWRFLDGAGKEQKQSATIDDAPQIPVANNSKQIFETTATAIEGEQIGTYYGSVAWGWERDGAGKFTRLPFRVKDPDVGSESFHGAADRWNADKTRVQLPTASGAYVFLTPTPLIEDPAAVPTRKIADLDAMTRLEITDKGDGKPFNTGPTKWWKSTVIAGTQIGKVGWIQTSNITDSLAGAAAGAVGSGISNAARGLWDMVSGGGGAPAQK